MKGQYYIYMSKKFEKKDKMSDKDSKTAGSESTTVKSDNAIVTPLDDSKLVDLNSEASAISASTAASSATQTSHGGSRDGNKRDSHEDHKNRDHSGHGRSEHRREEHKGHGRHDKPNNTGNHESKTSIEPEKTVNAELGAVFTDRSDRGIDEYVKPTTDDLFKLGLTDAVLGMSWQLYTDLAQLRRNFHYSDRFGLSHQLNLTVENILKVKWTIAPFDVGTAKNFDAAYSQPWRAPTQRLLELNNSIVNYYYQNADDPNWRAQGSVNSFYPVSSLPENVDGSLPYTPAQVDDIQLFSLDGGAFLKSTNQLNTIAPPHWWTSTYDCYVMPGIPGFNRYPDDADSSPNAPVATDSINNGALEGAHADPGRFVDRQFIYAGPNFTSGANYLQEIEHALNVNDAADNVMRYHYSYNDNWAAETIENLLHREVNRQIDDRNPASYPDYNYAVIQSDFSKLWKAHLSHALVSIPTALNGQLAGLRDEQAFCNAVQSAIHLGTFLRIMLYAIPKAYGMGAFVKAKLGALTYNDMLPRSVNLARFQAMWSGLEFTAKSVLPFIPYNKYSFDNFKLWFDATMNDKSKDAFDENNPVLSIRGLFCGMIPYETYSVCPHDTGAHIEEYYFPRAYNASRLQARWNSVIHGGVDNQWGYYCKSLVTQIPIFVPHGDALANFFTYFQCLFVHRPWTRPANFDIHGLLNPAHNHHSLTAMVDPLNWTGFMANFVVHGPFVAQMKRWLLAYVTLVKPFYAYIKSISDNSATIHFDDNVEYITPKYMETSLLLPGYKQHIIDYFQNTPRLHFANTLVRNDELDAAIADIDISRTVAVVMSHSPHLGFTHTRNDYFNPFGLDWYPTPRVALPISRNDSFLDLGTFGTVMYNVSQPWATSARRYHEGVVGAAGLPQGLQVDQNIETYLENTYSAEYLSGADIEEPFDMYQYFWYPSMWHMPYYPHERSTLVPAYEWPLEVAQNDNNGVQIGHANPTDFNGGSQVPFWGATPFLGEKFQAMRNFAYDYPADAFNGEREYHELFFGLTGENALNNVGDLYSSPATTAMRILYGSGNLNLVVDDQYRVPNISGADAQNVLQTRQNVVSIFTPFNARAIGLSTTRRNVEYSASLDGHRLYREIVTDRLCKSLGLPYLPFLYVSRGASLYFDQLLSCVPYFRYKVQSTDVDLSVKFANLYGLISKLRTGLFDGEAYPSSDGWGTDQITHPEKLNEAKQYAEKEAKDLDTNVQKMSA